MYSSIFKSENILKHFKNISLCGIIWEMIVTTLVFQGCHHEVPQTAKLKQQALISPFWGAGVQDADLGRAGVLCWLTPGFAHGHLLPESAMVSLLCVCVLISPSYKDIRHIEHDPQWSPLQWPHFTFITSLETLSADAVTFCSARVRMSTHGFGRGSQFSLQHMLITIKLSDTNIMW